MNVRKLDKIQRTIESYRARGGIKSSELEDLAKELGRVRSKRGSEPTFISQPFPDLSPLSIPHHGKDLNKFTAKAIIDQLQCDLDRWYNVI
jgi:hypothetical protein